MKLTDGCLGCVITMLDVFHTMYHLTLLMTMWGRYQHHSERFGSLFLSHSWPVFGVGFQIQVLCNSGSPPFCTALSSHVNQVNFPVIKWEKPKLGWRNKCGYTTNTFAEVLEKQIFSGNAFQLCPWYRNGYPRSIQIPWFLSSSNLPDKLFQL